MKKVVFLFLIIPFLVVSQYKEPSEFSKRVKLAGEVVKTTFTTVPSDFKHMGKNVSENWKRTALYAGIVAALVTVDRPVTEFYQSEIETRIKYKLPNITINKENNDFPWVSGNDAYVFYGMSAVYLGSVFGGSEKGQYAAMNGFKSLAYSILISHVVLKTIFGRARPYSDLKGGTTRTFPSSNDPYDFFNSRNGEYVFSDHSGTAMPSLHFTAFFAIAKVFQMEYDNYWIPYGFVTMVNAATIKGHKHWVSDMVAGAIIGTVIGRSVVKSSWRARGILPDKEKAVDIQVLPNISTRFSGLQLTATF